MTSHTPDGPLTAAQLRRRTERAASPRRTEPTPTSNLTGPSVGSWTAPPGKPGSWLRQAWHRQQADKARAEAVRKREQEDRKLGARLAAHRVQKNAEAAKQRRIASVIADPTRKNIAAVAASKAGRKPRTSGQTARAAAAGRPSGDSMAGLADLMRSHGLRDETDVYNHLVDRGMSHDEIERRYPSLFRGTTPGTTARTRSH
ncbi:hypothetical protein [Streptomyces sp. CCM_MD2014]|uniref:hypothetical protein n=1 Tax=Streptomyces sp. CCM_MD2014 TaxID=1561022 RepID=UPI00052A6655|nr:hypothetical protein [Streptomyces sp. CCM_MD2014]AIV35922.1 hypothetical protein NI25_22605 [Streptomyces sp. CCM_MD2014]